MPVVIPAGSPLPTTFGSMLLDDLGPFRNADHDSYLLALSQMFESITQLVMDQGNDGDPDYIPGWGTIFDVDRCATAFLPYLAQFVGVQIPAGTDDATARQIIRSESNQHRGTGTAIISAAQRNLRGTQSVTLLERTAADGTDDPWFFVLTVIPSEIISLPQLTADVNGVKPAGVQWHLGETDGYTWASAIHVWSADTFHWKNAAYLQP